MNHAFTVKGEKGFTTIEVLIASAVMLIIVATVFSLYLPSQRRNRTEVDVADVQANLRLALHSITKDVRMAGFLVAGEAIQLSPAPTATSFTIRTSTAARSYARIEAHANKVFTMVDPSMTERFKAGDKVRVFRPPNQEEPNPAVFEIASIAADGSTITLADSDPGTNYADGDMIVRTTPNADVINTVRYTFDAANKALLRVTNEGTADERSQVLARNITDIHFSYSYNEDDEVDRVEIEMTGSTESDAAGVIAARTRTVRTSVSLRNV